MQECRVSFVYIRETNLFQYDVQNFVYKNVLYISCIYEKHCIQECRISLVYISETIQEFRISLDIETNFGTVK